jgi:hypothetical protein
MSTNAQGMTNGSRSAIRSELGIIPGWAYAVAILIFVGVPFLFFGFVWPSGEAGDAPPLFRFAIPFVPGTFLAFLALMTGYVNRDAGRRAMNRTLWTLVVIFVPNAIGFILYFLMRSPLRTVCPKCETRIDPKSNYCPSCRYNFHPTCPHCKAAVQPGDTFCANCGASLNA